MKIKFSRHAKRRAKLYGISETTVSNIIRSIDLRQGDQEIIKNVAGFKYPIKIVVSVEGDLIKVVTNYPLKKGSKK